MRPPRPSPAMLVALLALFVALGGSSYAVITLSKNSVASKHIKNGQVKGKDIGKNAVTSRKVKDFSLLAQDFKADQLPAGPKGDKGDTGVTGERGPSNAFAAKENGFVTVNTTPTDILTLSLPAGSFALFAETENNNNAATIEQVNCHLFVGGTEIDDSLSFLAPNVAAAERESVMLSGVATLASPGQAVLTCAGSAGFNGNT